MVTAPDNQPSRDVFTPRIGVESRLAPFNPYTYFYVAFFGGVIAVAAVSVMNLPRLTVVRRLRQYTYAAIAAMMVAAVVLLVVAPTQWWDPTRNIRLALRVVAVVGGGVLYQLHKGPAVGTMNRSGEYMSIWKAIGPILGAGLAQGILVAIFGSASGAL